jgi:3D (Asp-Asp-Asp) domain-containing protein/uncharacterized membrane protein required for colicin V production
MAQETYDAVSGEMGQGFMMNITESICARLSWILVFYIGFALIAIVFFAIGNVLDLSFGLPGIENVNHIVGAVLGCVKGVGIIIVLACIFRYAGLLISAEELERSALQKQIDEQTSQIEALKEKAAEEEAARKEAERREAEARALAEKKAEEQRQAEAEAEALKQRQAESAAAEEATAEARAQAEEEAAAKRAAEAAAEEAAAAEAEARRAAEEAEAARKAAEEAAAAEAAQRAAEEAAAQKAAEEAARAEEEAARAAEEEESSSGKTYLGTFKITAYCHCAKCNGRAGQPTASGAWPYSGHTVAMGGVPFGTKLLINGTVYTVEDRGTPYGHVDIFMDSHEEALDWGLHYLDVYQVN